MAVEDAAATAPAPDERVAIRPRRDADLDACVALLAAVHAADSYPTWWPADPRGWLSPAPLIGSWVAERPAELAGHVALCGARCEGNPAPWTGHTGLDEGDLGVIARLFVAPKARGRGLGVRLVDVACAEARRRGLHPVLNVLESDRAAVALYDRLVHLG